MRPTLHVMRAGLAVLPIVVGCAAPQPATRPPPARDLLFSPAWTGLPTYDMPRSPWPATVAGRAADEIVEYRTTLYDLQGQFGDRDLVYRRFYSVRTGAADRRNY